MYDIRKDIPIGFISLHYCLSVFFSSNCNSLSNSILNAIYLVLIYSSFIGYTVYNLNKRYNLDDLEKNRKAFKALCFQTLQFTSFVLIRAKPVKCMLWFLYGDNTFIIVTFFVVSNGAILFYVNDFDTKKVLELFKLENNIIDYSVPVPAQVENGPAQAENEYRTVPIGR